MRTVILLIFILSYVLCGTVSSTESILIPEICVYFDTELNTCNYDEIPQDIVVLYFITDYHGGLTSVEFKCDISATSGWFHLSDNSPFTDKVGNYHNGTIINIGACYAGWIYLGCAIFQIPDPTESSDCAYLVLKNHPSGSYSGTDYPVGYDCSDPPNIRLLDTRPSIVNPVPGVCYCERCCPVPIEESSWGQIKSLYQ